MDLIEAAPERVASAVVFQTIGLDDNRDAFYEMFDAWAEEISDDHPEATDADWTAFKERMYGGDDPLFTASAADVAACPTPMLVLLGDDLYHPESSSRLLATGAERRAGGAVEGARAPRVGDGRGRGLPGPHDALTAGDAPVPRIE